MKKKSFKGEFVILSNDQTNLCYEDYVEFCEDNDVEPDDENSYDFWNWLGEQIDLYFESDLDNIKCCEEYNTQVRLNGRLGLWDGKHDIVETIYNSVYDAIKRICDATFDNTIEVKWVNGKIEVSQSHHDGTNYFEIVPKDRRRKFPYLYSI